MQETINNMFAAADNKVEEVETKLKDLEIAFAKAKVEAERLHRILQQARDNQKTWRLKNLKFPAPALRASYKESYQNAKKEVKRCRMTWLKARVAQQVKDIAIRDAEEELEDAEEERAVVGDEAGEYLRKYCLKMRRHG